MLQVDVIPLTCQAAWQSCLKSGLSRPAPCKCIWLTVDKLQKHVLVMVWAMYLTLRPSSLSWELRICRAMM